MLVLIVEPAGPFLDWLRRTLDCTLRRKLRAPLVETRGGGMNRAEATLKRRASSRAPSARNVRCN